MSAVVKLIKITHIKTANTAHSVNVSGFGMLTLGLACIAQGVKELDYAVEQEKELLNCDNELVKVSLLIKTHEGKEIGVIEKEDGIEFIVHDINCAITQKAIKKIKQRYAKHVLLHELQSQGYNKIKEEKLPNGKIRMVVERWE
ncbi:MAG: DUF1257 domain-containing protein [Bacteriovorax sp.]|jgi:hypothetical protein